MSDKMLTWEEAVQWLRDQPEQQELVQYCYYDDPLESAAERFSHSEEWTALNKLLKPKIPGKVLDIGAGRGISSYAFAKAGCSVTALEPDSSNLVGAGAIHRLAKNTDLSIQVVQDWGETLPFTDNYFDIVYGRAVLHHAQNLKQLCQEAARVLKPGGYFIATREHIISRKEDLQQFLDFHPLHHLYGGENAYLLEEYKDAISSAGLQIIRSFAPLESVINYAPMSQAEYQNLVKSSLSKFCGATLGTKLSGFKILQDLYAWYVSQKSNSPGRLYSFLAVKR
ncbi:methyltransferase domain-containing protein [Dolichospermum sp. ST_sed1]|uniref:class I SAM-dependent methyltransferase n=1 Tax=Dolichospermum lemmermannii TaxID=54295 RepID=UPI00232B0057|nr:class I SAM-dependent methyltransferase [Dolichospermum lemmermannii]MDD1419081.1 methyltransferase domain-containing protein [Dolichospermum sp. ST_sed1]MDD1424250.1 methyltransferase domain-containing protein [Dolichospermum sp. ST_sed9]MDD1429752.1 methyltransferase domain-containing protein [Dolichospermum sp. ST_sed6]MDD1440550.1 methyltransferase domain-containing protein [Dolichospermum sp. ST_sed3]MDD1446106.1 methyltransferase domain-containing protein [Dolichospermum sp. ST_sed8]